ncbi:MAG: pyruvate formate lyase-activating protein [Lachnospiraceae bacterium]|nr:pyruvate formate lyase-activating protein [Lachnospiraceae bacterium]
MSNTVGKVHSLETFGLVDGPGVRFVVFLQGCHMRCQYCHNPETWNLDAGETWTPEDLFQKVYRYKNYWGKDGGVTVSGGEPLLQIDFLIEFFRIAKEKGVHTTVDTSGNPFTLEEPFISKFHELLEVTDLFMLDIKEIDAEKHKTLTKWTNENILQMAQYLSDHGKDMWIRHVLVPELTDDEEGLKKLNEFIKSLKTVKRVEILPYHTLGTFKWENLGIEYPLKDVRVPTEEEVKKAEDLLEIVK